MRREGEAVFGEDDVARVDELPGDGIVDAVVVGALDIAHEETSGVSRLELVLQVESVEEGSGERAKVGEFDRLTAPGVFRDLARGHRRRAVAHVRDVGGALGPEGEGEARVEEEGAGPVEQGEHGALDPAVLGVDVWRGEGVLDTSGIGPGLHELVEKLSSQVRVHVAGRGACVVLDQRSDAHDLVQGFGFGLLGEEGDPDLGGGIVLVDEHVDGSSVRGRGGGAEEVDTNAATGRGRACGRARGWLATRLAHDAVGTLERIHHGLLHLPCHAQPSSPDQIDDSSDVKMS